MIAVRHILRQKISNPSPTLSHKIYCLGKRSSPSHKHLGPYNKPTGQGQPQTSTHIHVCPLGRNDAAQGYPTSSVRAAHLAASRPMACCRQNIAVEPFTDPWEAPIENQDTAALLKWKHPSAAEPALSPLCCWSKLPCLISSYTWRM